MGVYKKMMLQFCQFLYEDISKDIDGWAYFTPYLDDESEDEKLKEALVQKLDRLKELITERMECWDKQHCFL